MGCFAAAALGEEKVKVGDEMLTVPLPPGFVRLDGVDPKVDAAIEKLVPATNRLLLVAATPEDVKKTKAGRAPELKRYFMTQAFREAENEMFSLREFKETLAAIKKEYGAGAGTAKLESEINKEVANKDLPMKAKVGEMKMLGVFDQSERSIDFGMLASAQVDEDTPETFAIGASVALVRGRLIYFYAFSGYKGQSDITWVRDAVKAWREAVLKANPGGMPK
jgi:hypothetical protein